MLVRRFLEKYGQVCRYLL
jgi:hypothetical protein